MAGRYERFTRAFQSSLAPFDEAGPPIEVSPFAPGEVTTGAGIIRALTAIAGARRGRANYIEEQRLKNEDRRYRGLQTQALEQKLAEPDYEQQRIDQATVNATDLKAYRDRMAAASEARNKILGGRGKKLTPGGATMALKLLEQQGDQYAEGEMKSPRLLPGGRQAAPIEKVAQLMLGQLRSPDLAKRMEAARALGVRPAMYAAESDAVDEGGFRRQVGRPLLDERGLPTFDEKAVQDALAAWLATRKTGLKNQWRNANAPMLSAYQAAALGLGLGDVEAPEDPTEEAALEFAGGR